MYKTFKNINPIICLIHCFVLFFFYSVVDVFLFSSQMTEPKIQLTNVEIKKYFLYGSRFKEKEPTKYTYRNITEQTKQQTKVESDIHIKD